jgi:SpoVK/Ycf46/Vps4 family AAA+-type ATPase
MNQAFPEVISVVNNPFSLNSYRHLEAEVSRLTVSFKEYLMREGLLPEDTILSPILATSEFQSKQTALNTLVESFDLTSIEKSILILCAASELDSEFARMCSVHADNSDVFLPNKEIALKVLEGATQDNLNPSFLNLSGPLHDLRLVAALKDDPLSLQVLKIDPWVFQYLLGNRNYIPPQFRGRLTPKPVHLDPKQMIPESYQQILRQIATSLEQSTDTSQSITVQMCGSDPVTQKILAAAVCHEQYRFLHEVNLSVLSTINTDLFRDWLLYWHRRAISDREVLLIDCGDEVIPGSDEDIALQEILSTLTTPILLSGTDRIRSQAVVAFDIPRPTLKEQEELWKYYLGSDITLSLKSSISKLAVQFNLTASTIQTISTQAQAELSKHSPPADSETIFKTLWQTCRSQARAKMQGLVERKEPETTWDELILNNEATLILKQIIACVRDRAVVYGDWGMGGNSHRGMGITAMFHGPSGTGKTTAAEIIARELQIDLYRVDLSQVSNKYIGETEKNLAKVFDMAESSGALLLFDEADSIIGKRSEVKESKDRYANQEVGYLLQRMEAYSGVAILTTNLPNAIDSAFMRRIKYSIRFEYPNQEQRAMIWGKAFPPKAPKESLPPSLLAQLNISGASIRSIALSAAFLAATEKSAISMEHVLRATRAEYQKQGRKLTDREVQGWNQRAAVSSQ